MDLTALVLRFTNLGAQWVLWLLLVLSLVSVAIMIERAIYFFKRRVDVDMLNEQLTAALRVGKVKYAADLVKDSQAIECKVLAAGLGAISRGTHAVGETMLSTKARERLKMEAYLPILATLGNNAPFIGLLGTVLGIVKASHDLSIAQAAGEASSNAVMAGVFEALVATAVGLFVAIPAVIAFNLFQRRVRRSMGNVDSLSHLLLSMMKPDTGLPKPDAPPPPPPLKAMTGASNVG